MMPNMDPRAIKRMMDSMGIKNTEIQARRVIIEGDDKDVVIDSPTVTVIEMQGTKTFQIAGKVSEKAKEVEKIDVSEDDIKLVKEKTGVEDVEKIRNAIEESEGDIAEAIMRLNGEKS